MRRLQGSNPSFAKSNIGKDSLIRSSTAAVAHYCSSSHTTAPIFSTKRSYWTSEGLADIYSSRASQQDRNERPKSNIGKDRSCGGSTSTGLAPTTAVPTRRSVSSQPRGASWQVKGLRISPPRELPRPARTAAPSPFPVEITSPAGPLPLHKSKQPSPSHNSVRISSTTGS